MARLARLCIPGWPHLVVQSSHNRQAVFRDDADRLLFRQLLQQASLDHGVAIHAYGLQDDEVRLLATPSRPDALSRTMQAIGRRYGAIFNRRHGHTGSLWAGRFRATVIEPERHLLNGMRYVEGPGGGVDDGTTQTKWSSADHHLGRRIDPLISDHPIYWALGNTPFEREARYGAVSQQALTSSELQTLVDATKKSWPLGSAAFLIALSDSTDRRLVPLPQGRPIKTPS